MSLIKRQRTVSEHLYQEVYRIKNTDLNISKLFIRCVDVEDIENSDDEIE